MALKGGCILNINFESSNGPVELLANLQKAKNINEVAIVKMNGDKLTSNEYLQFKREVLKYIVLSHSTIFESTTENRNFMFENFLSYMSKGDVKTDFIINPWYLLKSILERHYSAIECSMILHSKEIDLTDKILDDICNLVMDDELKLLSICFCRANLILLSKEQIRLIRRQRRDNFSASEFIQIITNDTDGILPKCQKSYLKENGIISMAQLSTNIRKVKCKKNSNNKSQLFELLKVRANNLDLLSRSKHDIILHLSIAISSAVELRTVIAMYFLNKEFISANDILKTYGMSSSNHKTYKTALNRLTEFNIAGENNEKLYLVLKCETKKGNSDLYTLNKRAITYIKETNAEIQ